MSFTIRFATKEDVSTILQFIIALAKYEQLEHEVVATEDLLTETLFGARPQAETLLAFENDTAVGFALFFSNYSTFLGRAGIHLEDLFVLESFRGRGYGKALSTKCKTSLRRTCRKTGVECTRLEHPCHSVLRINGCQASLGMDDISNDLLRRSGLFLSPSWTDWMEGQIIHHHATECPQ